MDKESRYRVLKITLQILKTKKWADNLNYENFSLFYLIKENEFY